MNHCNYVHCNVGNQLQDQRLVALIPVPGEPGRDPGAVGIAVGELEPFALFSHLPTGAMEAAQLGSEFFCPEIGR